MSPLAAAISLIGSANAPSPFANDLYFPVFCVLLVAAAAVLAFFPIRCARVRRHRRADIVLVITLLWALLASGSLVVTALAQQSWSQEQNLRLSSGYADPDAVAAAAPAYPVPLWIILACAYPALLAYACSQKNPPS